MADLFKRVMMAAYDERRLAVPPMFLSSLFGKRPQERIVSETEKVEVDIMRDNRKVAVDVIRGGGVGNTNFSNRFSAKEYGVPLYWEEAPITASMLNKRIPGLDPYQPTDRMAALVWHATRIQDEQAMKIKREIERMCGEALQLGTITLKNSDSLDFKRKATHSVTPGTKWDSTGDPITDVRALCDVIFQDGKMKPDTAIFGSAAWDAFITNSNVTGYLDVRRIEPGRVNPAEVLGGATFQGRVWIGDYQLDLYSYNEFYLDASDTATPYVTTDSVILMNRAARLAMGFGAVEVLPEREAEYRRLGMPTIPMFAPGEVTPFVYEKPPAALYAGVQSAPIAVPTAIDTFGVLINVDT